MVLTFTSPETTTLLDSVELDLMVLTFTSPETTRLLYISTSASKVKAVSVELDLMVLTTRLLHISTSASKVNLLSLELDIIVLRDTSPDILTSACISKLGPCVTIPSPTLPVVVILIISKYCLFHSSSISSREETVE